LATDFNRKVRAIFDDHTASLRERVRGVRVLALTTGERGKHTRVGEKDVYDDEDLSI